MGAVYASSVGWAAASALDAGVDLILVSYDPDQYYRALHAAAQAWRGGGIDVGREAESAKRLDGYWEAKRGEADLRVVAGARAAAARLSHLE
jgi:beta-N-acetylhexosaminidase